MRGYFAEAWRKCREGESLIPLVQVIVEIIKQHPEYHQMLESGEAALDRDFTPEDGQTNPYLHMGIHISIQEQIGTDRPAGIRLAYQQLALKVGDAHETEHQMMECLGQTLWQAQRDNKPPDEAAYLMGVKRLIK